MKDQRIETEEQLPRRILVLPLLSLSVLLGGLRNAALVLGDGSDQAAGHVRSRASGQVNQIMPRSVKPPVEVKVSTSLGSSMARCRLLPLVILLRGASQRKFRSKTGRLPWLRGRLEVRGRGDNLGLVDAKGLSGMSGNNLTGKRSLSFRKVLNPIPLVSSWQTARKAAQMKETLAAGVLTALGAEGTWLEISTCSSSNALGARASAAL